MSHFTVLTDVSPNKDVYYAIEEMLAPYYEQTSDPRYLEFVDCTEEIKQGYASGRVDCIKTPDGRVLLYFDGEVGRFAIKDGKVVEKCAGPLKHEKRTKRSKKYDALPDYPMRRLYTSVEDIAERYYGYSYDEEQSGYGYYTNNQSFWDWYQIGGRWPFPFLVKEDCKTAISGERSWCTKEDEMPEAPNGYIWVAGAAKKDIEWERMKAIEIDKATFNYERLKRWFDAKVIPDDFFGMRITKTGIKNWNDNDVLIAGESLQEYLERHCSASGCKYPISFFGYMHNGEYFSEGAMGWWGISTDNRDPLQWRDILQQHMESIPDKNILVLLDCHV